MLIGLKKGIVEKKERTNCGRMDYFGNAVNIAARFKDFAKGNQIILEKYEYITCL